MCSHPTFQSADIWIFQRRSQGNTEKDFEHITVIKINISLFRI